MSDVTTEAKVAPTISEVARVLAKIATWMERQAVWSDETAAKSTRFSTLHESCVADAKNYRAMAREARAALAYDPQATLPDALPALRLALPICAHAGSFAPTTPTRKRRVTEAHKAAAAIRTVIASADPTLPGGE